jgi:DNA polymerase III subunit epsilon
MSELQKDWSDYVAIDFETANEKRDSACSIGLALVSSWEIVATRHWLIRPAELRFNPFNTYLHGIAEEHVANEPTIAELWPTLLPYLLGRVVIAHNASFDMSVMRHSLASHGLEMPELRTLCTYQLTKRFYPTRLKYSLECLCGDYCLPYGAHHAEGDAISAAHLFRYLIESKGDDAWGLLNQTTTRQSAKPFARPTDVVGDESKHQPDHPFYQKQVVFTGTMKSMSRQQASQLVADIGAIVKNSVTKTTNFLVVGWQDVAIVGDDGMSGKEEKAAKLLEAGAALELLSEADFLKLL